MTDGFVGVLHSSPFYEIAALLFLAAVVGLIGQRLRQPAIVSFIAVGIIAGPSALDLVQSHEKISLLAELGIAVLLFLVGLKLDLKLIRTLGTISIATGLGQVAFTAGIGFGIGIAMGMSPITAAYVAVALTFSSTIIIVKLLSDKKEVDSLHGRVALGFLIVQDLVVVLAMMVLSAIGIGGVREGSLWQYFGTMLLNAVILLLLVGLFMRYVANPLLHRIAHSGELLIIFAIAWSTLFAALGHYLGFSKELGGLLAGISLASTDYREAIVARLSSLRDFLLLFFFIALGSQLDLSLLGEQVGPALLFSLFVLVGNPLIVMAIMGGMGFRKRTGFLAGLTVAQISEFSLIFVAMGMTLNHVDSQALGLVTLVGLITIALSVYMITYSHTLYQKLEPVLGVFERRHAHREEQFNNIEENAPFEVILFGVGRYGTAIAEGLHACGRRVLLVDFDPANVRRWRRKGWPVQYGDACDQEFLASLPLQRCRWVISAMPRHEAGLAQDDPRLLLLNGLRTEKYPGKVAIATQLPHEVIELERRGVDLVLLPFLDAAHRAVERLEGALHSG